MTEEEAKTKWCPFARVLVESAEEDLASPIAGVNRLEERGTSAVDLDWPTPRCVASACMAWRTRREETWHNPHGGLESTPRVVGYCGLAGAPDV